MDTDLPDVFGVIVGVPDKCVCCKKTRMGGPIMESALNRIRGLTGDKPYYCSCQLSDGLTLADDYRLMGNGKKIFHEKCGSKRNLYDVMSLKSEQKVCLDPKCEMTAGKLFDSASYTHDVNKDFGDMPNLLGATKSSSQFKENHDPLVRVMQCRNSFKQQDVGYPEQLLEYISKKTDESIFLCYCISSWEIITIEISPPYERVNCDCITHGDFALKCKGCPHSKTFYEMLVLVENNPTEVFCRCPGSDYVSDVLEKIISIKKK
jgi:hypothetical protein